MTKHNEGNGEYGVQVKYAGGGTTTFYYETKQERDRNFSRIKKEVRKADKVSKKNGR